MINNSLQKNSNFIKKYIIVGSRRISNYFWALIIFLGSLGFLLTGFSSYYKFDILPFIQSQNILFFPQGLVMSFYGILGFIFSVYLWLTILWNVGYGFNEFNKEEETVRIFRWGFPGKNRRIDINYPIKDVEAIKVELKEGLSPKRTIFIKIKGKKYIPISKIGQPMTLEEIEKQATELAKFLQVSLE
uniref:Photosystem I assembly protein Ycf4 n=1 Tax=Koliella corcontica TaxID=155904 RepID=A0A097KMX8_9CHLO|nr:hypothetical chloroplast RF4 [Koliella corcontica]AIT94534.1 hypothetical chloroplast RF4 [Koliella corcontica]